MLLVGVIPDMKSEPKTNTFHLLQPAVAECPRNPHNFLLAGISQPTHMRAILKHFNTLGDLNEYIKIPSDHSKSERQSHERDFGTGYSVLLELVYFDPIRMTSLDPMHNLFLGTAKHMYDEENVLGCLPISDGH
jgi:hypothetical protein